MLIKTLLNKVERFKSFVYGSTCVKLVDGVESLWSLTLSRAATAGRFALSAVSDERSMTARVSDCLSICRFGHLRLTFVMRHALVKCPEHGVKVESLPWAYGKKRMTFSYQVFLSYWAKRLSLKETADIFKTRWDTVFQAVKFVVNYGLGAEALRVLPRSAWMKSPFSKGIST
ncbi:MAG: hypothetical protein EYX74_06075 [Desulfobulbaceae bacterium]|nr:MAG: hypothetical protein EYX74_07650 [Desulfobulbaceae bacterium]TBV80098.1 MAG: hypothetical protein EYX74_06075 [Desulfobulbaceae bacterium]